MTDKEFIKAFKKINLVEICKEVNANYYNIMSERAGYDTTHKVVELIKIKINELLEQQKDTKINELGNAMLK